MTIADKISAGFFKNPVAWVLLVFFIIAEYGNYQRGKELDRVCELSGPHDFSYSQPKNDKEEIDTICVNRQSGD
jgi:hypothetical protein